MLLFVYGTLKRGQRNHRLLADQTFVASVATAPGFRLFDLGPYPGMVRDVKIGPVSGELFDVCQCCLDELDDFEGVPSVFNREPVELSGGTTVWAYLYARPIPTDAPGGSVWPIA